MKRITNLLLAALTLTACQTNDNDYDASGIFEATEVVVSAKAQGEIMQLLADEGDDVQQGMALGIIDSRQLVLRKQQLEQTQRSTDSRRVDVSAQIASLEQQVENLGQEKVRFESLLAARAASQKQVDDIGYQISVLQRQIQALRDQLTSNNKSISEQSQAVSTQMSQVDEQIADATITAPLAGTVLQRYCEQGEYATPGKPLFKIADLEEMTLRAYITADQYNQLKLGQKVSISIDGQEEAYEGAVCWIASKAEFTPKTIQTKDERANLVYAIKVKVKNDGYIKIGMYGEVRFGGLEGNEE